jgi:hypothetical protein
MVASATQLSETRTRAVASSGGLFEAPQAKAKSGGTTGISRQSCPPASPRRRPARRVAARRGAHARRDRSRGRGDPRKEGHPGERGSGSCDERPVSSQAREPGRANRSRQQHDRSLHETEPAIGGGRRWGHRLETRGESVRAGDRSGQLGAGAKRDDDFLVRLEDQGCRVSRQPLSVDVDRESPSAPAQWPPKQRDVSGTPQTPKNSPRVNGRTCANSMWTTPVVSCV